MFSKLEPSKYAKALILSGLALSVFGITYSALSTESPELSAETRNEIYSHTVNFKNLDKGHGSVVYIDGKQVIWFISDFNGYKPEKRADVVAQKLNEMIKKGLDPNTIIPVKSTSSTEVRAGSEYLFLADKANADKFGITPHDLGCEWTNRMREALGGKQLPQTTTASKPKAVAKNPVKVTYKQAGYASWYGGRFHGRRTSNGARFNMNALTAAHKSLPFGSTVRVTNLRNKKVCIVKINDRGPYVRGRIIDVSKAAAAQLGMVSSGVSKVQIEVLAKG